MQPEEQVWGVVQNMATLETIILKNAFSTVSYIFYEGYHCRHSLSRGKWRQLTWHQSWEDARHTQQTFSGKDDVRDFSEE